MGRQATINAITGSPNYDVYVCDITGTSCVYLDTIADIDLPFTVELPFPYNEMVDYSIKIVDANNCIIIKTF